ncbi:hypothetical protein E8E11_009427 [Didymella keratinophila]|nr:hypothetical protein E8E11_009427 [Didymella keratinophila]
MACMKAARRLQFVGPEATQKALEELGCYRIQTELDDGGQEVKNLVWVDVEDWEEERALSDDISESEATSSGEESVKINKEQTASTESEGATEMLDLDLPSEAMWNPQR